MTCRILTFSRPFVQDLYKDALQLSQSSESPDFRRQWWKAAKEYRAKLLEDLTPSDSQPQERA